ncbi:hypothetical protein AM588_10008200 [Phytophthora nicotianae]|uniref:Uncharacterized protein n=1 Tax=Phytophthora nicotianae TaxID=4792 RepID=A0A0W8D386_PHYNI|nr:hypothetical protein AM588_10008200 [Phytophthora nicotianae]
MTTPATTSQRPAHAFCLTKRRSYTSPHLVRTRSKNNTLCGVPGERDAPIASAPKTAPSAATASRLTRKTQSFSEGLEPPTGERIADVAVFLGGSCNPTTWRHDVAMPMLDAAHVHYFNPQVDEWFEELIQIEAKAKETAQIVLMVVDGLTRSIVCINEAVEYICRGRKVMLVVDDIEEGTEVAGKVLSKTELADLNGARQCLRDLAHRRGVGLFPDVAAAIEGCIAYLTQTNAPRSKPEVPRLPEQHVQTLSEHFREIETQKATAELVLFVIPRNLRSIAAMTEAVELVSSHQALLLVIEPVEEGCMVEEGVAITGREFKDLARARAYLREMAERNDVAVFESVTQAVENIVERLE